jgi:hypothetical protein
MSDRLVGYLDRVLGSRRQALELVVVAVVLAAGINLLTGFLSEQLGLSWSLWLGVGFTLTAIVALAGRLVWPRRTRRMLAGFFVWQESSNSLPEHDWRYQFGSRLEGYLQSAFAESPALKHVWNREPVWESRELADEDRKRPGSFDLVEQATEYFALSSLTTHLIDYFNSSAFAKGELQTYSHTDVPDVLLNNRFMKLFSEPMEERAAFLDDGDDPLADGVVYAAARNGAMYERFELVLPRRSKVSRGPDSSIRIATPRLTMIIRASFDGWGTVLPITYVTGLMGLGDPLDCHEFEVRITVDIEPRRWRMMTPSGWQYYRWVDEWIESLDESFSERRYLDDIGYNGAETAFMLARGGIAAQRSGRDDPDQASEEVRSGDDGPDP